MSISHAQRITSERSSENKRGVHSYSLMIIVVAIKILLEYKHNTVAEKVDRRPT